MENKNAMEALIDETRRIEENNNNNMEHTTSINMLLSSNDLGKTKDRDLSDKFNKLNKQIEDINVLTQELLNDLNMRHN